MRVEYLSRGARWDQKLLCVTHSDRATEAERCSLNFLERRYGDPDRLPPSVPFDSLRPISEHQPYGGTVTIWEFPEGSFSKPRLVAFLRPNYKPQHAIWYQQRLWILGVDSLRIYQPDGTLLHKQITPVKVVEDPWLSGAHTILPDDTGNLVISCAASDSIILVDGMSLKVTGATRLPEDKYGYNYELSRRDSVVQHYITNDFQLTHLNCASPWRNGIVISTLIGAIGWFDPRGEYRELVRGFVGCHGVRREQTTGSLYFSDSCLGTIVFLDEQQSIRQRVGTGSIWLHDAQQLSSNIFAAGLTDQNCVKLLDISVGSEVGEIGGDDFGNGIQFLYYGN